MRAVLQRVSGAGVSVDGREIARIGKGLVVLLAVGRDDGEKEAAYIAGKVADLRVFDDGEGRLNLSVSDVGGAVLLVSQFTLYGDCRKGRRPSFTHAAPPDVAERLYGTVAERLREGGLTVETGQFQAMMDVSLVNDGPVTLILDSDRSF